MTFKGVHMRAQQQVCVDPIEASRRHHQSLQVMLVDCILKAKRALGHCRYPSVMTMADGNILIVGGGQQVLCSVQPFQQCAYREFGAIQLQPLSCCALSERMSGISGRCAHVRLVAG